MTTFRKSVKYLKSSKKIEEKLKILDEGLKKTGVDNTLVEDGDVTKYEGGNSYSNWRQDIFLQEDIDEQKLLEEKLNEVYAERESKLKELRKVDNYIGLVNEDFFKLRDELLQNISEEVFSNLPTLEEKIDKILKIYTDVQEGLLNEPPSTKNQDPLTPLDQNFVTFEQLREHYRLFISRISEQLATLGGGGETRLQFLDDIVGIATNPSAYNNKYLKYDDTLKRFVFDDILAIIPAEKGVQVKNVLYVTKDGNDANSGKKLGEAKATIKGAVAASTTGTVIKVSAGTYLEDNPIILPEQLSIVGNSLREVSVSPLNADEDLFYVSNGNYVAEMSYTGSLNPGKAIFAFNPVNVGYFDQSPYIQNCTNFIPNSIGLRIDGKHAIGPTKSMVLDSYTQYNQGGIGCSITNEGYAQLVSLFTICNDIAVYCGTGAACDLTNSNSSFGNYALIADSIGPKKYTGIITSASPSNADTFIVDLNTPTLSISTAYYDNVTGILTAYTTQPHRFSVGMGITMNGLQFTCAGVGGISTYPSGAFGYVFETKTVAPGRYVDSYNLIQLNKREIQDKSLASVALNHPDFFFKGDEPTNARSRYYDSYRLIQQNKQEIVDKSLASISIGFPSGFKFPDDPYPFERNRYYDAYRLIQNNKEVIVGTAWTNTYNVYPGISTTMIKCKRDLGYFIDAVATDVFTGGNKYSRDFTLQYFTGSAVGSLAGEEQQSIYAFRQASALMKQAITNTLVGAVYTDTSVATGASTYGGPGAIYSNTDPGACFDVQSNIDTLSGIITSVIGAGNTTLLSTFNESLGISTTNICARDLGYFVDAIATDIFTGGNKYSRDFTLHYFNGSTPVGIGTSEREQSVYAFNSARDYAKKAITNQLNIKDVGISSGPATYGGPGIALTVYLSGNPDACADVQQNINTLAGIVTTVIGSGSVTTLSSFTENLGTLTPGGSKCHRDLGYIIDALSLDVRDFTNENIRKAIMSYFDIDGNLSFIAGEKAESITAFNAVRDYAKKAITNQLNGKDLTIAGDPPYSNVDPLSCGNVQTFIDNIIGTLTTVINDENLSNYPTTVSMASTVFTANVGVSTTPNQVYVGGGNVKINVVRPFDGQVVYFDELYYNVGSISVISGGSGYLESPIITIEDPETEWGIPAQAVLEIKEGKVINAEMVSNGRGYRSTPRVRISTPDVGINTAIVALNLIPTYYAIQQCTPISSGICTITVNDNVPYPVGVGTEVPFFKQSRVLASGHSLEYIGSGVTIANALPAGGGVPIQANETDARNGGLVVFTSTDQSGNFRIGDGVVINQQTGTISGTFYSKSLFSTMTPFILALGGE